jgi:hypothetical protein
MGMVERTCACGTKFFAKTADVKRGWGKSCSKSCAAIKREKKTGAFKDYCARQERRESGPEFSNAHQFDNCEK